MSDLQCPATVVLTALERAGDADVERALAGRSLAGIFVAGAPPAAAARHAAPSRCPVERLPAVDDGAALRASVDALSDLHRGETIWVLAPAAVLAGALGVAAPATVTVAIDGSGWRVLAR